MTYNSTFSAQQSQEVRLIVIVITYLKFMIYSTKASPATLSITSFVCGGNMRTMSRTSLILNAGAKT